MVKIPFPLNSERWGSSFNSCLLPPNVYVFEKHHLVYCTAASSAWCLWAWFSNSLLGIVTPPGGFQNGAGLLQERKIK